MSLQAARGLACPDAENAPSLLRSKETQLQSVKGGSANIFLTAQQHRASENLDNGPVKPGKQQQQQQQPEKRRAFGDITNTSRKGNGLSADAQQLKPSAASAVPSVVAAAAEAAQQVNDGLPLERLAGKSWRQLELERRMTQEADIDAAVAKVVAAMQPASCIVQMCAGPWYEGEVEEFGSPDSTPACNAPASTPEGLAECLLDVEFGEAGGECPDLADLLAAALAAQEALMAAATADDGTERYV